MTIRSITQASESALGASDESNYLRRITRPITHENLQAASTIAQDLLDTMAAQNLCVGLAANQIGENLSIAVIKRTDLPPLVLLNPVVVSATGKRDSKRESCMSVWGVTADVDRRTKVAITYQDLDLVNHEASFEGFNARVIQHEIDHLNGVLYLDVAKGPARSTDLFENYSPLARADEVS